jgi:hypothetical protein
MLLFVMQAGAAEDPEACQALLKEGKVFGFYTSNRLFTEDNDGKLQALDPSQPISRYVEDVVYYIPTRPEQAGQKSVINIKLVYSVPNPPSRNKNVLLESDRWVNDRNARAQCSNVTIEGYDNFHMSKTRNVCLQYYFHQKDPNTLENDDVRRSFAFGRMVPDEPSLLSNFFGFVSIAGAATPNTSDAPDTGGRSARSYIVNYRYDSSPGTCVRLRPRIPQQARRVAVEVTNHGTDGVPDTKGWIFSFAD